MTTPERRFPSSPVEAKRCVSKGPDLRGFFCTRVFGVLSESCLRLCDNPCIVLRSVHTFMCLNNIGTTYLHERCYNILYRTVVNSVNSITTVVDTIIHFSK